MDKAKTKKLGTALVCLVIFFALLCIIGYLPQMGILGAASLVYLPVLTAALPLLLVYVYVACGYYYGTAVTIIGFGAAEILGISVSLYLAAAFVPLVLTAAYTIVSHKRFRTSVILNAAAALAGAALVFLLASLFSGMSVVDFAAARFGQALSALPDEEVSVVYTAVRYSDLMSGAVTQAAINATPAADAILKMQDIIKQQLNVSIVYLMVVYSMAAGYLSYIVPRAVVKKQGRFVAPIPKFKDYELPKKFWLAAVLLTAAAFVGDSLSIGGFEILLFTLFNVFLFVFMVQGFGLLLYFFEKQNMSNVVRVFLAAVALVFLSTIALPIIGLFENIFRFRQRIEKGKEQA